MSKSPLSRGCRRLPWDSDQFGIEVVRLERARMSLPELRKRLGGCQRAGAELVYWMTDPEDAPSNAAAEQVGGILVDRRCVYERLLTPDDCVPDAGQTAEASMLSCRGRESLAQLALQSGQRSRFRVDPGMPDGAWEGLYRAWMDRSLSHQIADAVLIECDADDPIGMITVSRNEKCGVIGLFGVDEAQRGRGVGAALLSRALCWFQRAGCERVEVATQGHNVGARRIYERAGFTLASQTNVFHFWMGK